MRRLFESVQALRFVAAAMVVVTHSTLYTSERLMPDLRVWPSGTKGVDIFFVISGFVMIMSSQKLIGSAEGWKIFAQKRIARIVPLYWTATTLKLILLFGTSGLILHSALDYDYIVKSYFFVPDRNIDGNIEPLLGVGWTLNFEMFFYLIFTMALAFRKNIYPVVGSVLLGCSIMSAFRPHDYPAWMVYFDTIVLEFFLGMVIGELTLGNRRLRDPFAVFCAIIGFVLILLPTDGIGLPRIVKIGIPAAMVVWGLVSLDARIGPLIPRWLLFAGNASYAIYLFHPLSAPAGAVIMGKLGVHSAVLSVMLCWTIGVSVGLLVHRCIEPLLDLNWWSRRYMSYRAVR